MWIVREGKETLDRLKQGENHPFDHDILAKDVECSRQQIESAWCIGMVKVSIDYLTFHYLFNTIKEVAFVISQSVAGIGEEIDSRADENCNCQ